MKLIITGWNCKGLRCPDIDFRCLKNDNTPYKIVFFQIPNGTGKTTMLDLIKSALSGALIDSELNETEAVNPMSFQSVDKASTKGHFQLQTRFTEDNVEWKAFWIKITFDFTVAPFNSDGDHNDEAVKFTTYLQGVGEDKEWDPPAVLVPFLEKESVNIFTVEGHKTNELVKKSTNNAIDTFCGIKTVNTLIDYVEEFYIKRAKELQKKAMGEKFSASAFTRAENQMKKAEEKRNLLVKDKQEKGKEKDKVRKRAKKLRTTIRKDKEYDATLDSKIADYKKDLVLAEEQEKVAAEKLIDAMRNPAYATPVIHSSLDKLRKNMKKHNLPEDVGRPWFEELIASDKCICDRPMDEEAQRVLTAKKEDLLEDGYQATLQQFKTATQLFFSGLDNKKNDLKNLNKKIKDASALDKKLKALEQKRNTKQIRKLKILKEQEIKANQEFGRLKEELKEINRKPDLGEVETGLKKTSYRYVKSLVLMEKIYNKLVADFTSLKATRKIKTKKEKLIHLLMLAINQSRLNIKISLTESINHRLDQIIDDDPNFRIEEIDEEIKLRSVQAGGSGGQKKILAYALIVEILKRSNSTFPLIIDHPTSQLDDDRRPKSAEFIPAITEQNICFLIKYERDDFVDVMEQQYQDDICYVTVFKNKKLTTYKNMIKALPKNSKLVSKSSNGYLCYDKDYFWNFTISGNAKKANLKILE